MDTISQVGISVFGVTAIILVARKNKWGFVWGAFSQPFWIISSYINGQWGIFLLSIIYAGTWIYGIWEWFFQPHSLSPVGRQALDRLTQELLDSKRVEVALDGEFSAEEVSNIFNYLEAEYRSLGGQELHFRFTPGQIIAQPRDVATW